MQKEVKHSLLMGWVTVIIIENNIAVEKSCDS